MQTMRLQQMIDNGYADKLTDYPEYKNFERIQIGEFLIFIYHPSKDEYVAQLIQGNDILDSEEYSSHYSAFNKCLEYMKAALDASGYVSLEDCEQHPNSLQYSIEKHFEMERNSWIGNLDSVINVINRIEFDDCVVVLYHYGSFYRVTQLKEQLPIFYKQFRTIEEATEYFDYLCEDIVFVMNNLRRDELSHLKQYETKYKRFEW